MNSPNCRWFLVGETILAPVAAWLAASGAYLLAIALLSVIPFAVGAWVSILLIVNHAWIFGRNGSSQWTWIRTSMMVGLTGVMFTGAIASALMVAFLLWIVCGGVPLPVPN